MEIITLSDFCVVAEPAESFKTFIGTVGPVIVDDLAETKNVAEEFGAEIVLPITEGPTGHYMFTRTRDNVVIEYVEWTP